LPSRQDIIDLARNTLGTFLTSLHTVGASVLVVFLIIVRLLLFLSHLPPVTTALPLIIYSPFNTTFPQNVNSLGTRFIV
jgi:hypothetical protein